MCYGGKNRQSWNCKSIQILFIGFTLYTHIDPQNLQLIQLNMIFLSQIMLNNLDGCDVLQPHLVHSSNTVLIQFHENIKPQIKSPATESGWVHQINAAFQERLVKCTLGLVKHGTWRLTTHQP